MYKILAINPGSTSTRIAVFEDDNAVFEQTIAHPIEVLEKYPTIADQYIFREQAILKVLYQHQVELDELSAVVGRGGSARPMQSGIYRINQRFKDDCRSGYSGQHASSLGAVLADTVAQEKGIPSFTVDPPVVDEMSEVAKVTGLPGMRRKSKFHALNQKASAKRAAAEMGKKYEEARIIVAHLGSGISIGAHENGRVVDVNDCYDAEGPIMPERSGSLPVGDIVRMCYAGMFTQDEIQKKLTGKGGVVAHLGTNDMRVVAQRAAEGDKAAQLVYEAMAYHTAKFIAANAAVLKGKVDAIVITGGVAHDGKMVNMITERVSWIAPVKVYPGENEMSALAKGVLSVLRGEREAKIYGDETILE